MSKFMILTILLLYYIKTPVYSQDNNPRQQVQNIRIEVYTRVLNLNDEEAKKFWPVFNEMQARLNEIKKKSKIERLNISDNYNKLTDAQMEHSLDNLLAFQQQALDIQKKYYQKFKKLIPIKKVALLPNAEREFKKELLKIIQGYRESDE